MVRVTILHRQAALTVGLLCLLATGACGRGAITQPVTDDPGIAAAASIEADVGGLSSVQATAGNDGLPVAARALLNGLPLVQRANVRYQGAFATPENTAWTGRAIAAFKSSADGSLSLFYRGHDQKSDQLAQISVPAQFGFTQTYSQLPRSTFIQGWGSVTDGELDRSTSSVGDSAGNGAFVYGLLVYNNRLIVAATTYYSSAQSASHGVSTLNLSESGDFKGFFRLSGRAAAFPRAMGGAMTHIPPEWQVAFGGTVIATNAPVSVISANSFGPSMTVFDPDSLVGSSPPSGQTLVFYPQNSPLCGVSECEQRLNDTYTWMSGYVGRAFVPGTRTILAIGVHPTGEMWYGGSTSPSGRRAFCDDGGSGQKASGMETRVLAFDALDLLDVKSGRKRAWEVRPYATWRLPEIESATCWDMISAAFEPDSGQIFVAVRRTGVADFPAFNRIEVFKVSM